MSAHQPVIPQPAATVVLVRERNEDLEVFLTRRHRAMAFLGGFYVFPGGKVEAQDLACAAVDRVQGLEAALAGRILGLAPDRALAHWIAAIRETFEETAILLARGSDGAAHARPIDARLRELRRALHEGEIDFAALLGRLGLTADAKALYY
ncbi:MAG: NUDIX domain-containing protein, partial [Myxococcales bacterium]|nr:NUDIX domain-containing protein [Myxococcales bacterium]